MPLKGPFTQIEGPQGGGGSPKGSLTQYEGPKCTLNELKEGDEQQLDTGSRGTRLGDGGEVNLVGEGGPDDVILGEVDKRVETGPTCQFYRGRCKFHKIRGEKIVKKVRNWVKKKYGYGWLTTTVIEYSCPSRQLPPSNQSDATSMMDSRSPEGIFDNKSDESFTLGQSVDNFHEGGRISGEVEITED